MITSLVGANSYLLHRQLQSIVDEFIKKYGDLAVERLEGPEVEARQLVEVVQSLPFLAQRKLIVVRDFSQNPLAGELIEQIISSTSESTDLVFYETAIDRRSVYFKVLKSQTELQDFPEIDSHSLPKWLVEEAKKQSAELSMADANYLVERLGPNQLLLASELDKLITYEPRISRQNIDFLTEPTPQSRIFDLLDAAFRQDKTKAIRLYEEQRAQRVEPQAILAMMAWQLRLLAIAKYMGDRSPAEAAKETGISEYPLRKAREMAGQIEPLRLKQLINEALDIDLKSKTSPLDLDEALKTYITTL